MIKRILISFLITALVSFAAGSAAYFFKVSFWGTVITTFLLQVLFFYFWNGYQEKKVSFEVEKIENDRLSELAKQTAVIQCSACREKNLVPIRLDEENKFECTTCKKLNSVYILFEAAQTTTPLTVEQATVSEEIVKELAEKAVQQAIDESNKTSQPSNAK